MHATLRQWIDRRLTEIRTPQFVARAFAVLVVVSILGITVWRTELARDAALEDAQRESLSLVQSVAQHAHTTFDIADVLLGEAADRLQTEGVSDDALTRLRKTMADRLPGSPRIGSLGVYSPQGVRLAGSAKAAPDSELLEETLAYHRADTSGRIRIGLPRVDPASGRWEMRVSRRFERADGEFAGMLVAAIDCSMIEGFFRNLQAGPLGWIGLRRLDGTILASVPRQPNVPGVTMASETTLPAGRQPGASGAYNGFAPMDGIRRLSAFRAIDGYPLVAVAALAEADILTHWQTAALHGLAAALVVAALLGALGWRLAAHIKRAERLLNDANSHLQKIIMLDGLTGIGNRRCFDAALQKERRRAARTQMPLALMMIDVDHFKAFNDTYGHQAGDTCLRSIARTMSRLAQRPADLAARYGGEEFALLLPETEMTGAVALAQRAREAVRSLQIEHSGGIDGTVSVSIGVAVIWPQPSDAADQDLVALADRALYRAKAEGRNRVSIAAASQSPQTPQPSQVMSAEALAAAAVASMPLPKVRPPYRHAASTMAALGQQSSESDLFRPR